MGRARRFGHREFGCGPRGFAVWLALALVHCVVGWAEPAPAQRAVVVVIDGCRPEYLELAPTPNIDALGSRGTRYAEAMVGHLVSDTPPGHATLVTGLLPRSHGIVAHEWIDRNTGKKVSITGLKAAADGNLLRVYPERGIASLSTLVKRLDPRAYVAAVTCGKYYAAMLMGGPDADEIVYFPPDSSLDQGPVGDARDWTILDTSAVTAAIDIVKAKRPKLLLINLPDTDRMGHFTGGVTAPDVMSVVAANVDTQIGRLVAAYRENGMYDETVFCIVADHGQLPSRHVVHPRAIWDIMRRLRVSGEMTHEHLWLSDPTKTEALAFALADGAVPGAKAVYYRPGGDPNAPYRLAPGPTPDPAFDTACQFLLSTYAGPQGPDVVFVLPEDTVIGSSDPNRPFGVHTGLTWHAQHIPMVWAGPGIAGGVVSSAPATLADVTPTLCRLLGLRGGPFDGVVLNDALAEGSAADATNQDRATSLLGPVRDALKKASQAEAPE
ncbi:MAG TPA: alkaline phosphatase family protein [Armatimonadota bacterium]|nr:alkaline phosphatase family protein [Armatimonadota bacterium]